MFLYTLEDSILSGKDGEIIWGNGVFPSWNGLADYLPSGMYIYALSTSEFYKSKKMILVK